MKKLSGTFRTLRGTAPRHMPDSARQPASRSDAEEETLRVTLVFRAQRESAEARRKAAEELADLPPARRRYLDVEALEQRFGPDGSEVESTEALVRAFAARAGLRVIAVGVRAAVLEGTVSQIAAAFRVQLDSYEMDGRVVRSHAEDVSLPEELAERVDHVLGLHDLPRNRRHEAFHASTTPGAHQRSQPAAADGSASGDGHVEPEDLAGVYAFPTGVVLSGPVKKIAIISLGGGFYDEDVRRYFGHHGVQPPHIKVIRQPPATPATQEAAVDGRWAEPAPQAAITAALDDPGSAANLPMTVLEQMKWTVEITMDVQLIGRICPGVDLVIYFAENTNQGEYWAFSEALYGPERPDIISCSWGSFESDEPDRVREVEILDSVLLDAALLGTTICGSSGDRGDGCASGETPPVPRVEFPAASPNVLACGGTMFVDGDRFGSEVVWNETVQGRAMASGGGFSTVFPRPHWQPTAAAAPTEARGGGRGVPDVAAKADVQRGYCMMVAGRDIANGGTSAAAPLWAGLLALAADRVGARLGSVNALLYSAPFRDVVRGVREGTNGIYRASAGWNPCTGLGSPIWTRLCEALIADAHSYGVP